MRGALLFPRGIIGPQLFSVGLALLLIMSGVDLQALPFISRPGTSSPPVIPKVLSNTAYAHGIRDSSVDCARQACMALTFDDGPNPYTTPRILSELEAAHVQATFFVVGSRVAGSGAILRRMHRDGDEIGNHSWSHPPMTLLSPEAMQQQVARTQAAVIRAGVPAPTLFRPPYGLVNNVVRANVPLTIAMWNNDPEDWDKTNPTKVTASVLAQAGPGRVVDMHDIYESTAEALPGIIKKLHARHYRLVTFSQLFNLSADSPGEYFGR